MKSYNCGVLNCGNGKCVHSWFGENCPYCGEPLVIVTTNRYIFCTGLEEYCGYGEYECAYNFKKEKTAMQCDTGELRAIAEDLDMDKAKEEGFTEVPSHLQNAARRKLKGKKKAMVSLTSGGVLSKFAAEQRKKKKAQRKTAKKSRQANR